MRIVERAVHKHEWATGRGGRQAAPSLRPTPRTSCAARSRRTSSGPAWTSRWSTTASGLGLERGEDSLQERFELLAELQEGGPHPAPGRLQRRPRAPGRGPVHRARGVCRTSTGGSPAERTTRSSGPAPSGISPSPPSSRWAAAPPVSRSTLTPLWPRWTGPPPRWPPAMAPRPPRSALG